MTKYSESGIIFIHALFQTEMTGLLSLAIAGDKVFLVRVIPRLVLEYSRQVSVFVTVN